MIKYVCLYTNNTVFQIQNRITVGSNTTKRDTKVLFSGAEIQYK